jgi:hypothetical protein
LTKTEDGDTVINTLEIEGLPTRTLRNILDEGADKIKVYDSVGNVTVIDLSDSELVGVDDVKPTGSIEYDNNQKKYKLTLVDNESGLWKVVRDDGELLDEYEEQLKEGGIRTFQKTDDVTLWLADILDIDALEIYDAVGNKEVLDLTKVKCIVTYALRNHDGSRLAINVMDPVGIAKVGIVGIADGEIEKIIEVFAPGTTVVRRYYELPAGTPSLKVHSRSGNIRDWEITECEEDILTSELVSGTEYRVASVVGIRKIVYDDGNEVEFKKETPVQVKVNTQGFDAVTVYDTLDNMVQLPQ